MRLWHVTSPDAAAAILEEGFLGGWGDAGFGVYLFADLGAAEDYAADGGWDGSLTEAVILEIEAELAEIDIVIPDPGWPNPEDYEHVRWHPMDPDEDETWPPARRILPDDTDPALETK
ncbi:hypothetical protein LAZ40_09200 [Cereibacter sphaeroides]|uniref:hypothetical protein n=1 Tax=Cereibacter sphaeroides TaxID=1063 RepID=UPI001F1A6FF6|nr:hypothetical protein [Cereibacter sphaeroides]MCE6959227.1 hypothetical protein [Cereibacter sphaeroides]MCE6972030.1 hypothetical protein [Cereibacter sphaeroides]